MTRSDRPLTSAGILTLRPAIAVNGTSQVPRTTARPAEKVTSGGRPEIRTTLAGGALSASSTRTANSTSEGDSTGTVGGMTMAGLTAASAPTGKQAARMPTAAAKRLAMRLVAPKRADRSPTRHVVKR